MFDFYLVSNYNIYTRDKGEAKTEEEPEETHKTDTKTSVKTQRLLGCI